MNMVALNFGLFSTILLRFKKGRKAELEISGLMLREIVLFFQQFLSFHLILSFLLLLSRSLVRILEKVDPRKMKREEKLAFWINIHNALVMHVWLYVELL
jgi:hypothetical protein